MFINTSLSNSGKPHPHYPPSIYLFVHYYLFYKAVSELLTRNPVRIKYLWTIPFVFTLKIPSPNSGFPSHRSELLFLHLLHGLMSYIFNRLVRFICQSLHFILGSPSILMELFKLHTLSLLFVMYSSRDFIHHPSIIQNSSITLKIPP